MEGAPREVYDPRSLIIFYLRILSINKNNFIPSWNIILIFMGNGWSGSGSDG
jgi:hypothetical protein